MDQPLDLSLTNLKTPFTIEYLTSDNHYFNSKRKLPLIPLENKPSYLNYTEVKNVNNSLEIVNGGHGIKNPLFDCATEALQIRYGIKINTFS